MNDIKVPPFTDGQRKVIEATEKLAEKRGGIICDVDGIDDDVRDIKELLEDTISRIEEPTNEDWLRSASTEELAEWLFQHCDCIGCPANREICHRQYDDCKTAFLEWLQEIKK